jgi:sucrose-6-phosphate hydrolase SacC (GH32 family)
MVYKHWQCMSAFDLEEVIRRVNEDSFDGHDSLPTEFEETVTEALETGKVVKPPVPTIESCTKPKKARKKAQEEQAVEATEAAESTVKVEAPEHEAGFQVDGVASPPSPLSTVCIKTEETEHDDTVKAKGAAAAPKPKAKKTRAKKRPIREEDTSEEELEYVPKKSRSRSTPFKGTVGLA